MKWGQKLDADKLIGILKPVATATTADGCQYQIFTSLNGVVVRSETTRESYVLPWRKIVELGIHEGLDAEAVPA